MSVALWDGRISQELLYPAKGGHPIQDTSMMALDMGQWLGSDSDDAMHQVDKLWPTRWDSLEGKQQPWRTVKQTMEPCLN